MSEIRFTIRATSEEVARQQWIAAGIIEDAPGWTFRPSYDVEITATQGWSGIIVRTPEVRDAEGNVTTQADVVPGWHANAVARGVTYEAMTAGLAQTDAEGNLLPLMQRTWAAYVFGLVETQGIDPASGFPYQATTSTGAVQYGDMGDIATPANVRQ